MPATSEFEALGFRPDGTAFLVHATAAYDYGAGALLGLVAGSVMRADGTFTDDTAPMVGMAGALTASLMERGRVDPAELGARYRRWPTSRSEALPLVSVPLALFYAGQPESLTSALLMHAVLLGADATTTLATIAVANAISAGVYELEHPYEMATAAVVALDAAVTRAAGIFRGVPAAHVRLREDLRVAVIARTPNELGATSGLSLAMRRAFWHLLRSPDVAHAVTAVAQHGDPTSTALTGALLGAAFGVESMPTSWQHTLSPRATPLTTILVPAE